VDSTRFTKASMSGRVKRTTCSRNSQDAAIAHYPSKGCNWLEEKQKWRPQDLDHE
jgi:hypothetical protein